jgi:hypothetical protein
MQGVEIKNILVNSCPEKIRFRYLFYLDPNNRYIHFTNVFKYVIEYVGTYLIFKEICILEKMWFQQNCQFTYFITSRIWKNQRMLYIFPAD